jgi:GTP-sensing pleiotropic transcriptional regulator CodY
LRDVAENRDFISLSHEMEIPMAEIARHVGGCGSVVVKAIQKMESAD